MRKDKGSGKPAPAVVLKGVTLPPSNQPSQQRIREYSQEIADLICERMANGESVTQITKHAPMPTFARLLTWVREREAFQQQYARAMELRSSYWAELIMDVADDGRNDFMERQTRAGNVTVLNAENVNRSRLRVDSMKWLLAKLQPKKYGDKTTHELTGADGGPILSKNANADDLTDEQLAIIARAGRAAPVEPEAGED